MIKIASIWQHPSDSNKKMVIKDPASNNFYTISYNVISRNTLKQYEVKTFLYYYF